MSDAAPLIAVDILTGFLGSGKTTLIRRLVESGRLRDTAILVNEFAALPLDQRLIALSGGSARVVGNGCICCVVDGSVRDALIDLAERRASGDVPPFSRVLIETSGIADPAGLVATLALDRRLKPRFRPGRVVTLIDVMQDETPIEETGAEALSQLVCADLIVLSKAALAPQAPLAAIAERISSLNPLARIAVDDGMLNPFDEALLPEAPYRPKRTFLAASGEARHDAIRSGVLRIAGPVDWQAFATWLSLLAHRHGGKLLRLKGTLTLAGGDGRPVLVQSVRHIVHRPEHLPADSAPDGLELVVILRDLEPALLQRSLEAFLRAGRVPALSATG